MRRKILLFVLMALLMTGGVVVGGGQVFADPIINLNLIPAGHGDNSTPTGPVDNHGVASTPAGPIECRIANKGTNSNFTSASPEQCHDMGGSVTESG